MKLEDLRTINANDVKLAIVPNTARVAPCSVCANSKGLVISCAALTQASNTVCNTAHHTYEPVVFAEATQEDVDRVVVGLLTLRMGVADEN